MKSIAYSKFTLLILEYVLVFYLVVVQYFQLVKKSLLILFTCLKFLCLTVAKLNALINTCLFIFFILITTCYYECINIQSNFK